MKHVSMFKISSIILFILYIYIHLLQKRPRLSLNPAECTTNRYYILYKGDNIFESVYILKTPVKQCNVYIWFSQKGLFVKIRFFIKK